MVETVGGWGADGELIDRLALVTSELVTNAVVHADGPRVVVTVEETGSEAVVRVTDQGEGGPAAGTGKQVDADEHGRGLVLVYAIADRWGCSTRPGETTVWASFALTGEPAREGPGGVRRPDPPPVTCADGLSQATPRRA